VKIEEKEKVSERTGNYVYHVNFEKLSELLSKSIPVTGREDPTGL
jgi:hypothetical protein